MKMGLCFSTQIIPEYAVPCSGRIIAGSPYGMKSQISNIAGAEGEIWCSDTQGCVGAFKT